MHQSARLIKLSDIDKYNELAHAIEEHALRPQAGVWSTGTSLSPIREHIFFVEIYPRTPIPVVSPPLPGKFDTFDVFFVFCRYVSAGRKLGYGALCL